MNRPTQQILPAVRTMKDFDKALNSGYSTIILLHAHIAQLASIIKRAQSCGKNIWVHIDMVDGLKNDENGTLFVCQTMKPDGIISTKKHVILAAKKARTLTVQRLFLLDSRALEQGLALAERLKPDFIEVLPGVAPKVIQKLSSLTDIPLIAGGLIADDEDVTKALEAGAMAISTSQSQFL